MCSISSCFPLSGQSPCLQPRSENLLTFQVKDHISIPDLNKIGKYPILVPSANNETLVTVKFVEKMKEKKRKGKDERTPTHPNNKT